MSDSAILTRLATLEAELAGYRAARRPDNAAPDLTQLKAQMLQDPRTFFTKVMGLTPNELLHVDRVNTAHVLGDQAPPEMRYLALQGPQLAQTSALASSVEDLSRRLNELLGEKTQAATRDSVKTLAANQEKYPHLSKAFAKNPALIEKRAAGRTGSAEDIAKALEDEAAEFAAAYGVEVAQPASDGSAVSKEAPSMQSKPAPLAGVGNDPPPLPKKGAGPMTPEEDAALQAALTRKYSLDKS